jgi:hypothetical protein
MDSKVGSVANSVSNLGSSVANSVSSVGSSLNNSVGSVGSPETKGWSWYFWLFLIFCFVTVFMFVRPYIQYLNQFLELINSLANTGVNLAASTSSGVVDNTTKGSKVVVNKLSGKQKPKLKQPVVPDDSSSSVQESKKFCYVGEWKGVRSCVKVNGECKSNQRFETEELCMNPELR